MIATTICLDAKLFTYLAKSLCDLVACHVNDPGLDHRDADDMAFVREVQENIRELGMAIRASDIAADAATAESLLGSLRDAWTSIHSELERSRERHQQALEGATRQRSRPSLAP